MEIYLKIQVHYCI